MEIKVLETVRATVMMVCFMVMDVKADSKKELKNDDFDILCAVAGTTLGVWHSVNPEDFGYDEQPKLDNEIKEIFFGSKWKGHGVGVWNLPDNLSKIHPKRSDICRSNNDSEGMPSASKSIASAFFCLCTPKNKGDDSCGLNVESSEGWPEDGDKIIGNVFEELWGDGFDGNVMKRCGNYEIRDNFEKAKEALSEKLEKLGEKLQERTGILGLKKDIATCNEEYLCANVTKNPIWMEKLRKIAKRDLIRVPLPEKIPEPAIIAENPDATTTGSITPQTASSESTPASEPSPISPKVQERAHKKESQKSTEEKPNPDPKVIPINDTKPEKKPKETHQKEEEEEPLPDPKSETNATFITSQKRFLWVALLI